MFSKTDFTVQYSNLGRYISIGERRNQSVLILLHGMFGGLSNFDQLLSEIKYKAGSHYVIVPELPLFSLTPKNARIKKLSEWLESFLDDLAIEKAHLLGNSLGGHIALDYAYRYSNRVGKLILTGSSGLIENELGGTRPKRNDRAYVKRKASKTFYNDMVDENMVDEILEILGSSRKLINIIQFARNTHTYNMANILPDIHHETLLIWGRQDVITPPDVALQFYHLLPNATLRWIDLCGHAPMMEHPSEFLKHLDAFFSTDDYLKERVNF